MTPSRILFRSLLLVIVFLFSIHSFSQTTYGLTNGASSPYCTKCKKIIDERQREVLFGIQIEKNGDIYFSITNKEWFNTLFTDAADGLLVDIVSKDRYDCARITPRAPGDAPVQKGTYMPPVYRDQIRKNMIDLGNGTVAIKLGTVPASLANKEIEGNLGFINKGAICFYTTFSDIERSLWDMLPMGLYADTLINTQSIGDTLNSAADLLTYTKKIQFTVPFAKNKATYNKADVRPLYDSLHLTDFTIKKIDIRAYSSVEGDEKINMQLQQQRAASMISALQQFQSPFIKTNVTASENWVEFLQDVKTPQFDYLSKLSRPDIKLKLLDKSLSASLESILQRHRKAVVTVYLDKNDGYSKLPATSITTQFREAIQKKDIAKAAAIEKEIFQRIADNQLPTDYLNKLEIPQEKTYMLLLNNREVYKYLLDNTYEDEALVNFQALKKLDPLNGRINYNICALTFKMWQYDTSFVKHTTFYNDITALQKYGVSPSLVKRMLINYNIVMCERYMSRFDYAAKDRALQYIKDNYASLSLGDEELYSLAKYFCYYARCDWSTEMITDRVNKIDANEDLVFYYVNLLISNYNIMVNEHFKSIVQNAISLNRNRFCRFFNPIGKGGISIQLLDDYSLNKLYCENCTFKK